MKKALLIIAKRPAAGYTKTRLSPPLSPEEAAQLYACFLQDMLNVARQVPNVSRFITYSPSNELAYFKQLAPDFALIPQQGADLGERLDNVLTHCLTNGFEQAIITSSDSPTLPPAYLKQGFEALNKADVVLGPCDDGGYYLIGLTKPQPRLLREVKMSTPTVLQDTLILAQKEGLQTTLLPTWYDIDTIEELKHLQQDLRQAPTDTGRHSREFLKQRNYWSTL